MSSESKEAFRCGYAAIVGRPNVGKSTLLNHLLGQKLSITSRKPQTTRHSILGIANYPGAQILFVDTPGIHRGGKRAINRHMNRAASSAIKDVDVVVMVVDGTTWTEEDEWVIQQVEQADCPALLVINKIDQIEDKSVLLPHLQQLAARNVFDEIVPVSALRGQFIETVPELIAARLPEADAFFEEDQLTDRSERFLASELLREKIMRQLGDELPYATAVEIERFKMEGRILHIDALILVEREGQKRILIGEGGSRLRSLGQSARIDMEQAFDNKVMLRLWVKVREGWSDDERALRSLGYADKS